MIGVWDGVDVTGRPCVHCQELAWNFGQPRGSTCAREYREGRQKPRVVCRSQNKASSVENSLSFIVPFIVPFNCSFIGPRDRLPLPLRHVLPRNNLYSSLLHQPDLLPSSLISRFRTEFVRPRQFSGKPVTRKPVRQQRERSSEFTGARVVHEATPDETTHELSI